MARIITTKYAGKCADCGATLPVGTRARWYGRGKLYGLDCHDDNRVRDDRDHEARPTMFDEDGSIAEARRDDHEYAMGVADANRYLMDKKIYGAALADEWEMDAEMARYNRGEI